MQEPHEYVVDVSGATSWEEVIAAFNLGFVHPVGGNWGGGLEAFNDYLSWPDDPSYRLIVKGWEQCVNSIKEPKDSDGRSYIGIVASILLTTDYANVVFAKN